LRCFAAKRNPLSPIVFLPRGILHVHHQRLCR
jgi:hypothetical protein